MKLKDFAFVAGNDYVVNVYQGNKLVESFHSNKKSRTKMYENATISSIDIFNDELLAVDIHL